MGAPPESRRGARFYFPKGATHHDTGFTRQHRPGPAAGEAGHPGARLSGVGGRRGPGGVRRSAGGVCLGAPDGLRRPAHHAVLCGYAPPCPPVSHAGHGHGPAPAGLAEYLHLPHRGPVRRPGLCPADLPPSGHGPDHQRHHPGVHVLLPAYRGHLDPHGGAGAGRRHRLRGQGEHGPQRPARHFAGDHGAVHIRDAALAGWLPLRPHKAHHHPPLYPQLHR